MKSISKSKAVVIVSTGGIAQVSDIPRFLFGMFTDRRILPYNRFARLLLATMITVFRWPKTYDILKQAGPSPVLSYTQSIVKKLENRLDADLFYASRYTRPKIEAIIDKLKTYEAVFIVSLFPQFSYTTVGSFMDRFEDISKNSIRIDTFYKDDEYIGIIKQKISDALKKIPINLREKTVILFSAHSLPLSLVKKTGDPYIEQITENVRLIAKQFPKYRHELSFQSKLGPIKWAGPATLEKVIEFSKRYLPILIVPISFIIDNSETLYEIDLLYKTVAKKWGASAFVRADCPNDDDRFVKLIAKKIEESNYDL